MKKLVQTLLIVSVVLGGFLAPVGINSQTNLPVVSEVYAQENEFQESSVLADCDWNDIGCEFGNILLWYFELIWYKTTQIVAFLAAFALDILLFHSVSSATYRTGIIEVGWEVLRNMINIVFIFSLLTIAFKMVLGGTSSGTKSALIKTLVVALIINFSLFVSYLIIDASNILANIFYTRIETEDASPENLGTSDTGNFLEEFFTGQEFSSPSSAIVNNFQPQAIVNNAGGNPNFFERWLVIFASGGLNILMIVMFLSITLLFLGRTIGLIFSAILAPLAFATLTLPFGSATSLPYIGFNTWLKQLISLAFMAPVYLFFLFLIITFSNNDAPFNAIALQPEAGVLPNIMAVFIPFALIATLIFTAKKVSKTMAGELGGAIAGSVTKVATGIAAGAAITATGGAAMLGGATRIAGKVVGFAMQDKNNAVAKWAERKGKHLQTTGFDVSKIPGFKGIAGDSKVANFLGSKIGSSYANVDTSTRQGLNKFRAKASDMASNRTPEAVENWEKNVQESRNKLTERRLENRQEFGLKNTKIDSKDKDNRILTGFDPTTGAKAYTKELNGKSFKDALDAKSAQLTKRTSEEAKIEKDNIEEAKKKVDFDIEAQRDQIKNLNSEKKGKGKTEQADIDDKIRQKREKIKELEKNKKTIESTSLEGQIKQLEKLIDRQKTESRANLFKEDLENRDTPQDSNLVFNKEKQQARVNQQAANVAKGEIKSTPKVGGDPENTKSA